MLICYREQTSHSHIKTHMHIATEHTCTVTTWCGCNSNSNLSYRKITIYTPMYFQYILVFYLQYPHVVTMNNREILFLLLHYAIVVVRSFVPFELLYFTCKCCTRGWIAVTVSVSSFWFKQHSRTAVWLHLMHQFPTSDQKESCKKNSSPSPRFSQ